MEQALARGIVCGLRDSGIGFIAYLPETRLSQILPIMREDPAFMLVPVANESEGVSIAAGASLGGTPAAVYMKAAGSMFPHTICS
jgi:sulfopyruvate decarboxylase TPP-binding subunit